MTIQIKTKCKECGKIYTLEVKQSQYDRYIKGDFAQHAFPNVSPEDRELHFISGICGKCWDNLFAEEEE